MRLHLPGVGLVPALQAWDDVGWPRLGPPAQAPLGTAGRAKGGGRPAKRQQFVQSKIQKRLDGKAERDNTGGGKGKGKWNNYGGGGQWITSWKKW